MRKATSSTDRAPASHVRANPAALRGPSNSLGHDADYVSHVTDIESEIGPIRRWHAVGITAPPHIPTVVCTP
jgi:hypothetical protein